MNEAFFAAVRRDVFGGGLNQKQVDGINAIETAWREHGDGDKRKLAYVLATAFHETARTMQPIEEYGSATYLKSKAYYPFHGRGYVQLTWLANYQDWSKRLGVDLVKQPTLAMDPRYAGRILVQGMTLGTFTGKKLGDYFAGAKCDWVGARKIVNGTDKDDLIAGYARSFFKALEKDVPKTPDHWPGGNAQPDTVHPPITPQPDVGKQTNRPGAYITVGAGVGGLIIVLINFLLERFF